MLIPTLITLYILVAISIVISLLLNGVRPSKTLAWLLAIFTIPVGGIILYLLLGRNRRKQKLYSIALNKPEVSQGDEDLSGLSNRSRQISRLISKHTGFPVSANNNIKLLRNGEETFSSIFEALQKSEKYIHLQYYIFEEGELADRLLELFRTKKAAGVSIRLIYDNIGSYSLSKKYLRKLKETGVEVYSFFPFRLGKFISSLNYRNHRKIIVVDGHTAFTGGINVSDKYLKGDTALGTWHDMHLKICGQGAHHLNCVFVQDWNLVSQQSIEAIAPLQIPEKGKVKLQVLATGPDDDFPLMEQLYFSLINSARKHVYITNPYIIPSHAIQIALQTAALSGVDVRLMVSAKADSALVSWCVQSYFQRFLKAGVKIYLYPEGFLHSKIITVDNKLATIGTANVDDRSFQHNYEVNAVIYNRNTAGHLSEIFLRDCEKSEQLEFEVFRQRPWSHKLAEGATRTISPLL